MVVPDLWPHVILPAQLRRAWRPLIDAATRGVGAFRRAASSPCDPSVFQPSRRVPALPSPVARPYVSASVDCTSELLVTRFQPA